MYKGTFTGISLYWRHYGGWRALAKSFYLHLALFLSVLATPYWLTESWYEITLQVLPNVLGFALGGYAIWMSFGDKDFRELLSKPRPGLLTSPYLDFSASFAHLVMVQVTALLVALGMKIAQFRVPLDHPLSPVVRRLTPYTELIWTYLSIPLNFLGFLLLVYAITSAVAATMAIFRVAMLFEKHTHVKSIKKLSRPMRWTREKSKVPHLNRSSRG